MKTAAEYVAAACATPFHSPAGPTITTTAAQAAVQQALDDADKYRQLLARATRNATATPSPLFNNPHAEPDSH